MALFSVLIIGVSLFYRSFAAKSTEHYFLGGRNLPWWLAGTSMVATTFAADTPLAVTELIAKYGIAGNWLWWNMLAGGMLVTFLFATFWRRSGVGTDLEIIEYRYSGRPARVLRVFRSLYFGLVMNILIMAWVNLAMLSLLQAFFPELGNSAYFILFFSMFIVTIYSTLSGLKGVVVTDNIQFWVAMLGCTLLAYFVLDQPEIGGLAGLKQKLPQHYFDFFPRFAGSQDGTIHGLTLGVGSFFTFIGIQWWASWYPGSEPGGGGYVAQRMLSTRSEKDSLLAVFFFQLAHYGLRPWPWIIVALASLVLYPDLSDKKLGFAYAIRDFLPVGVRGLLFVSFVFAYFSTISTQLNWGSSYLLNDFLMRVSDRKWTRKQSLRFSYGFCLLLSLLASIMTLYIDSVTQVWSILIECGAGLGLFMILRWFWWRINAQSEIVATIVPFMMIILNKFILAPIWPSWGQGPLENPIPYIVIVLVTVIAGIVTCFITAPTDRKQLILFYQNIRPLGWWKEIDSNHENKGLMFRLITWIISVVFVYSFLFSIGSFLFGTVGQRTIWFMILFLSGIMLSQLVKKILKKGPVNIA
jgi:Na+/proline symporter